MKLNIDDVLQARINEIDIQIKKAAMKKDKKSIAKLYQEKKRIKQSLEA